MGGFMKANKPLKDGFRDDTVKKMSAEQKLAELNNNFHQLAEYVTQNMMQFTRNVEQLAGHIAAVTEVLMKSDDTFKDKLGNEFKRLDKIKKDAENNFFNNQYGYEDKFEGSLSDYDDDSIGVYEITFESDKYKHLNNDRFMHRKADKFHLDSSSNDLTDDLFSIKVGESKTFNQKFNEDEVQVKLTLNCVKSKSKVGGESDVKANS